MNGIPLINGNEYSWGDIVCNINGAPVANITAIEYKESRAVENIYGAGTYPVARGYGNIIASAKITLLMSEVVALAAAEINHRLDDIAPFDIIVSYIPINGLKIIHDKIRNCQFKGNSRSWKQGDTTKEIELELIVSHIKWGG
jgi:hypothetical protein